MQSRIPLALLVLTLSLFRPAIYSQTDDRVLLRINDTGVTAEEFIRLYTKNKGIGESIGFDDYFSQFVIFRLKVEQAIDEKLDTAMAFRREFEGYRNQLAKGYLTDNEAREELLRKAFSRLQYEISASHILVACTPSASPEDTLAALNKALEIRTRLVEGESFSEVAKAVSDDPSAALNGGSLGWFTAMQMVTQFEDAVYALNTGDLSEPFRSPYGYHIVRIDGKRPSSGRIKVAHIMKAVPPGAGDTEWNRSLETIIALLDSIKSGASFGELAARESDHRESASSGGTLEWFGSGEIVPEFSEAAFSLMRNGDISGPVKTPYGWHIIRRLDKRPLGSFEENRAMLESRLSETHLNSVARRSLVEKLKVEYNFVQNHRLTSQIISVTDSVVKAGGIQVASLLPKTGNIFSFNGGALSLPAVAGIIEDNFEIFNGTNAGDVITRIIENKAAEMLISIEDGNLESKHPDFRYLVKEFHDGMLLFEINSREVWNKPYSDSTGLYKFYQDNLDSYNGEPSASAIIYSIRDKSKLKLLEKLVRKSGNKRDGNDRIRERFITDGDTTIVITEGRWSMGDDQSLDEILTSRGIHTREWNGRPSVINIVRLHQPEPKPFEEVRHEVAAAYQDFLDKEWVAQLRKRYSVWVNEKLLEELKAKLNDKN